MNGDTVSDSTFCSPAGDITIFEIADFKTQLQAALDIGQPVTIDLGQAGTLDISALQLLIAACRSESVHLTNVPAAVATRLTQLGWEKAKDRVAS
jgi:anti-anti-sigma regulatory factor